MKHKKGLIATMTVLCVLALAFVGSPSGNTEQMATYIQEQTGGDLLKLEPKNPYPTDYEE